MVDGHQIKCGKPIEEVLHGTMHALEELLGDDYEILILARKTGTPHHAIMGNIEAPETAKALLQASHLAISASEQQAANAIPV